MGALAAGGILAKEGKKILMLERHYAAGGYTHVFKRPKYEWDVGIHYIGEVHYERSFLRMAFDYISDKNIHWAQIEGVYDKIVFGDKIYEFHTGTENFKAKLKEYFPAPKDQEAIDKYVELIIDAVKASRKFFSARALPPLMSWFASPFMQGKMLKYSDRTTREVLEELTDNEKLIGVLTGQYGDYGLPPAQSSFIMHAMVARHYLRGAAYPIGGAAVIAEEIAKVIAKAGGVILTRAEVTEILVEGSTAVGVKMLDGKELRAPLVISNAGVMNTYSGLLSERLQKKYLLPKKLDKVSASASHVALYIGMKYSDEELGLEKANYWVYPDNYNHDETHDRFLKYPEADLPVAYISFPSAKDPDFQNRYPGRSTIQIITIAPYEWFAKWEDNRWKKRGAEYDALKEHFSQRLLDVLFRYFPQLKGKIDHYELSSPLSTRHFANYQQGEIYGVSHTPDRFRQKFLRPHTPISGLFMTGQDIVTAGIGGALMSGLVTASAIMRKDLSGKIVKESLG